jgi:thiosulfate dehydrogenase (quinone) large subunit
MDIQKIVLFKLRLVMAFIFLWAFVDKTFGLGFATALENAWLQGGSPTYGFLTHATHGPFAELFQALAGLAVVDWLFMLGLLGIGLTLALNKFVRWGAIAGIVLMLLMWLAALPPENNPIVDDHIVYALVLALLALVSGRGAKLGGAS